jgi:ATP-binding cassette subfamily F protein 3
VISHDRYFLDRTSRRIIELENGRAASYMGNYSAFLVEREVRRETQQRAYDNQQQLIAKTEEFIRRNIAGQKTKQAKSRRKMLEKLDRLDAVRPDQAAGDFSLQKIERTGNHVLMVERASIGYPGTTLAADISFILRRSECLGIIGPNGSGKTTFLKTILRKIPPLSGEVRWGTKVQIGYYAQQLDDLDDRNEVIMELSRVAPSTATAGELRSFLAKFLFTGDDVYKHVNSLSGGEKGRLALAKLIYSRVNVLVLDEPTNHLDIPSREALEEALDAYEGTIVTISHDRYFLDRVATQILALDGAGNAEHYDGDYTEYHDWKLAKLSAVGGGLSLLPKTNDDHLVETIIAQSEPIVKTPPVNSRKSKRKSRSEPTKTRAIKVIKKSRPTVRSIEAIESEISDSEKRLEEISARLAVPENTRCANAARELNLEYQEADERLRKLYQEWEQVSEGLSQL